MFKVFLLLLFSISLYAKTFTVASYNVENLFDLKKDRSDYKEYIPNTNSKWNQKNFNIKLNNLIRVLKDMDSDIIALQEVENKQLMKTLLKKLPKYRYYSFAKYKNSSVGIGFLSKIKIKSNKTIEVKFSNKIFRPILESTFEIDNLEFKVFNNHWPSKRVAESFRVKYAKKLFDRIKKLPRDYDYILLGDFNSNYNEMQTLKFDKRLNNTNNLTGINQVLNTTLNSQYITFDDVLKHEKKVHLNLWLDLAKHERFSNRFRNQSNTPDNILLSPALLDNKKISYLPNSFKVFKPSYLYKNNKIIRWQMTKNKYTKVHKGSGFSDHLPIYAKFSSNKEHRNPIKKITSSESKQNYFIKDLYTKVKLIEPVVIKDTIVIYKTPYSAIIKQKNDRAIYIYKNIDKLKLGFSYDLKVNQIKDFNGLEEIIDYSILKEKIEELEYKSLYLNASKIDILNPKYKNEIVTKLNVKIKGRRAYFDKKNFIDIYSKNKTLLPKSGSQIVFNTAHLSQFRGNPQILIHKKSDYEVR